MRYAKKISLYFYLATTLVIAPMVSHADEDTSRSSQHRAASPNNRAETLFALGIVYEFGHGVPADPYRAAQYYYRAAAMYAARGALQHFNTCRDAMRRLNPEHPYLKPLEKLVDDRFHPA